MRISTQPCEDVPNEAAERCDDGPRYDTGRCEALPADHPCAEYLGTEHEVFVFGDLSLHEQGWTKQGRLPYR